MKNIVNEPFLHLVWSVSNEADRRGRRSLHQKLFILNIIKTRRYVVSPTFSPKKVGKETSDYKIYQ